MTKNISDIEKCAKLIGLDYYGHAVGKVYRSGLSGYDQEPIEFNPLTNKSDLMDMLCALKISVTWSDSKYWQDWSVIAMSTTDNLIKECWVQEFESEQSALAHAVVAVAVQIYDRREGWLAIA